MVFSFHLENICLKSLAEREISMSGSGVTFGWEDLWGRGMGVQVAWKSSNVSIIGNCFLSSSVS